jgi:hypothetical protein
LLIQQFGEIFCCDAVVAGWQHTFVIKYFIVVRKGGKETRYREKRKYSARKHTSGLDRLGLTIDVEKHYWYM